MAGPCNHRALCTPRILPAFLLLGVLAGCQSLRLAPFAVEKAEKPGKEQAQLTAGARSFRQGQFVFWSDFDVPQDDKVFLELGALRERVYKELQLPPSDKIIQVHLFENRDRYEQFMHARYPDLPKRRAFFVAQPHVGGSEDLLVYTFWGERVRGDLRHELTHALLHSVLKDVPLWLDEGLAEYYEVAPEHDGVCAQHLEQLRSSALAFSPDLARLEQLNQVQQMTPAEYCESWAWVHLMLKESPEAKTVLTGYLQTLRTTSNPGPIQTRLAEVFPNLESALERHLAQVESEKEAASTVRR
jgi:hypothetical protein